MAVAQYPFQCIQYVCRSTSGRSNLIVAAAGARIYCFSAENGDLLSIWPSDGISDRAQSAAVAGNDQGEEPPEKKRKLSLSTDSDATGSHDNDQKNSSSSSSWSTIPLLIATSDGSHVIAVTAEDKCVRVFELSANGTLTQLSQRIMPKRPCALSMSVDGQTIYCGDKFGDVFALPLIPTDSVRSQPVITTGPLRLAATSTTVHSKRNLNALQQQLRQKSSNPDPPAEKQYQYDMLLGHVSMLTAVTAVSLPSQASPSGYREWILTADRDEHIRVSRGPPQTHIIETYCLGHTSFVSSLCVPKSLPRFLVSGGGDNFLLIWDWKSGQLLQKAPITQEKEVAVRGIWEIAGVQDSHAAIVFALEGYSELRALILKANGEFVFQPSAHLSGNVLDVSSTGKDDLLWIAVDGVNEPQSTEPNQPAREDIQPFVEVLEIELQNDSLVLRPSSKGSHISQKITAQGTEEIVPSGQLSDKEKKALKEILYGLENLRKKN